MKLKIPSVVFLLVVSGAVSSLRAAVPANPSVELPFSEGPGAGNGLTTTNLGTLSGTGTFADPAGTNVFPAFSTNVPAGTYVPSGNLFSVDLGTFVPGAEGRAVDLVTTATPPGDGTLGALPRVTVCAWVNVRTLSTRNTIAYALESSGGLGFSFGANSLGKLGLGINEDFGGGPTSLLALPLDGAAGSNNWVFVAATYDPNLPSEQLKYYVGRPDKLAYLDSAATYTGGDITSSNVDFTGDLTVGNYGSVDALRGTTSNAGNPLFRGLLDEVRVYTNALTLDQIQQAQINNNVTPVAASIIKQPSNKTTPQGQNASFDVDATGSGQLTYQWKTNGVNVAAATNSSFTMANVTLAQIGTLVSVGVSNSVGGVLSSSATLTVVPANPHLHYLSYVEGNSRNTNSTISSGSQDINSTNAGVLQGSGHFGQKTPGANGIGAGTYPVFSTFVPVGPYAPSPLYNQFSLNMGDVRYTNYPNGAPSSQGQRWVDYTNTVGSPVNALGAMSALTICCWVNPGTLTFRNNNGGMGVQIVFAELDPGNLILPKSGFAFSYKADWTVQLNVNEYPGGGLYRSSGYLPVVTGVDGNAVFSPTNWHFVAVTYDGTLTSQNLNYYFGTPDTLATLDVGSPQDANRGIITNAGPLTIGNCNGVTLLAGRLINGDNAAFFRGFIDEVHIFSRVLTLQEIQQMQVAPAYPGVLQEVAGSNNVVLSWEQGATPLLPEQQLQSRTNLAAGTWSDVTNPTNVSGTVRSLSLPTSGDQKFFRLRNK
jgi:hypothetical protein